MMYEVGPPVTEPRAPVRFSCSARREEGRSANIRIHADADPLSSDDPSFRTAVGFATRKVRLFEMDRPDDGLQLSLTQAKELQHALNVVIQAVEKRSDKIAAGSDDSFELDREVTS